MAHREGERVRLVTRAGNDFSLRFPAIAKAFARLPVSSCVVDGEAIVCDENGLAVLLHDATSTIVVNEHYEGDGEIVFKHACKLGCEGIVSKRLGSPYKSGRSAHWVKVKNRAAAAVAREAEEDWAR